MLKERIKALMDARGWDQKTLAERAGVSRGTVCYILSGKSQTPYGDTLTKLAGALGTTTDYLLSGKPPDQRGAGDPAEQRDTP